jgi:hypothetical protein
MVVLEEPIGSGGLVVRVSGRKLDADFIRRLPEATTTLSGEPIPRSVEGV